MDRLLHRLIDHFGRETQQGADAGGGGGREMGDMIDLVFVKADRADQVDMDLIGGENAGEKIAAAAPHLLSDRDQGRDVVAGMGVIGGEVGVVEIQFAHRGSVGPGRPFGLEPLIPAEPEHRPAARARMGQGLRPCGGDRRAVDGGDGDGGVIDDAVDHHRRAIVRDRRFVGGDGADLPRQLLGFFEIFLGRKDPDGV